MNTCEQCYTPNIDELKKVVYQDMTFCSINCFVGSKYFDHSKLDFLVELEEDYAALENEKDDFEKINESLEYKNQSYSEELQKIFDKYDDDFEKGNEKLDEILLALAVIKEECEG